MTETEPPELHGGTTRHHSMTETDSVAPHHVSLVYYFRTCNASQSHAGQERRSDFFYSATSIRSHHMSSTTSGDNCSFSSGFLTALAGTATAAFGIYTICNSQWLFDNSSDACGMPIKVPATSELSAKRAANVATQGVQPSADDTAHDYIGLSEEWPNEPVDTSKHEELKQDEASLLPDFTWEATAEEGKKFDAIKIEPSNVMRTANTKALSQDVHIEEPTYSRKLGLVNPLHSIYHSTGKKENDVKFGKASTWFGGTDAYYGARDKNIKGN